MYFYNNSLRNDTSIDGVHCYKFELIHLELSYQNYEINYRLR